jgi:CRP-like cAMP-binding protein
MYNLSMTDAHTRRLAGVMKKLSFFSNMSMAEMEHFLRVTSLYGFEKGETVFKKGHVGDALYIIHSGKVRVLDKAFFFMPAKTIATLGEGDVFGEMALLDQPYRTATVVTAAPTELFVLLTTNFNDILNANPMFHKELNRVAKSRAFERKHK